MAYFAFQIEVLDDVGEKEVKALGVRGESFDDAYNCLIDEFGKEITLLEWADWTVKKD